VVRSIRLGPQTQKIKKRVTKDHPKGKAQSEGMQSKEAHLVTGRQKAEIMMAYAKWDKTSRQIQVHGDVGQNTIQQTHRGTNIESEEGLK
jgi:hypothetical protein